MKKFYFGSSNILEHDSSYRSRWSESKKQLLDDTKKQILSSIQSGNSLEAPICSDLGKTPRLSERYESLWTSEDSLTLEGAYKYGIRELLCEGEVVKLNSGHFHVPTTECEKTLAKRLVIALAHYNPKTHE